MSDLLTHEEYSAIANSLNFPTNAFINGQFQSSKSGNTFETINPATGKVIANVAACNADDVDHAVIKARRHLIKDTGQNFILVRENKLS